MFEISLFLSLVKHMKYYQVVLSLTAFFLVFSFGCKKSKNTQYMLSNTLTTYTDSISTFTALGAPYVYALDENRALTIFATTITTAGTNGYSFQIKIDPFTGNGVYKIGTILTDTTAYGTWRNVDSPNVYVRNSLAGSVTITSSEPNVEGTYSFYCTDSSITSGSFTAKLAQ
jgi:hypothetical protein